MADCFSKIAFIAGISCLIFSCEAPVKKQPVELENETTLTKEASPKLVDNKPTPHTSLSKYCLEEMTKLPGAVNSPEMLASVCKDVQQLDGCISAKGEPIFHFDKKEEQKDRGKRILTLSLIHGDEMPSGTMARAWMERLQSIDSRNAWRVIPIANPDGKKLKTRTNANKVDLNRNFPTDDWENSAIKYWKKTKKSDPRKYPGPSSASEIETQCLIQHIKDFKPDFIISIHTPYGLLDFDGPKSLRFPQFKPLPWISLGNYPGSLGRYMWVDNNVPVLTIELKGPAGVQSLEQFDRLQDISGTVAIQADRFIKKSNKKK